MGYRHSDVPYFSGHGGITPPNGNNAFLNTGSPASYVCTNGTFSEVSTFAPSGSGFTVDNNGKAFFAGNGPGSIDLSCNAQNGGVNGGENPVNSGWHAWYPDLVHGQVNVTFAIMTRF
jgi:hypothetical protein